MNNVARLRTEISDYPRLVLYGPVGIGDGARLEFKTPLAPVINESEKVYVNGAVSTRDTDYAIELDVGLITFVAAPADATVIQVSYRWTVFSDIELADVLEQETDVTRAAIRVVLWMLADASRFIKYFFGQEMVDRTKGIDALKALLAELRLKSRTGLAGIVRADTDDLEEAMSPFIEQTDDLFEDVT